MTQAESYLDPKDIKRLSVLQPWRTASALVLDWAVIVLCIIAVEYTDSWLLYVPAVMVIGGRQHALGVLLHDFAHFRFVSNKHVSEWTADLFLAWPLLGTLEGYRRNHLGHHRYLNTDQDPDWKFKLGSREFTFPHDMKFAAFNLLGYFTLTSTARDFKKLYTRLSKDERATPSYRAIRLTYYVVILGAITWFGVWPEALLYWFVPYFTFFFMFMYIRSVADHFGPTMNYEDELQSTRTVMPHFGEAMFFSPHNINYHIEHHLYASVPFYNLPELQRLLMKHPEYARRAHFTHGFVTGLWREIVRPKGAGTPEQSLAPAE
ncbi:MAG: fatty acid desaturase family protein [Proteobacteria bacterium]|nr:fatty acid desaturase family protein [Pseudomonadota bacterium]